MILTVWYYMFVFLYGYKPSPTILASTQIAFFFFIPNFTDDIELNLKTFSFTAMRAKLCWHLTPLFYPSAIISSAIVIGTICNSRLRCRISYSSTIQGKYCSYYKQDFTNYNHVHVNAIFIRGLASFRKSRDKSKFTGLSQIFNSFNVS